MKNIKIITIILVISIIGILIIINLNNKNNILQKQLVEKEKLEETSEKAYIKLEEHFLEVKEKEEKLVSFKTKIAEAITNKGIETSVDDIADTMANNIEKIKTGSDSFSIILSSGNGWDQSGTANFKMDVSEYSSCEITNIVNAVAMNATGNYILIDGENIGKPYVGMKVNLNGKSNIEISLFTYSTSTYKTFTVYVTFYK